jgi:Cu+-exporting ATPase
VRIAPGSAAGKRAEEQRREQATERHDLVLLVLTAALPCSGAADACGTVRRRCISIRGLHWCWRHRCGCRARAFTRRVEGLRAMSANMDVLVALGTSAAYLFSVYMVLKGSEASHLFSKVRLQ